MRRFSERSINQKLVIITLGTTGLALLLAGLGNVLIDSILFRGYLQRDLSVLARVIADNSTAAISFNDPATAAQTLAALRERSHVSGACIYRNTAQDNGKAFAQYSSGGQEFTCPLLPQADRPGISTGDLALKQPILLQGRTIGTLVLFYDLGELNDRVRMYGSTILGVLLAAMIVAFLLSNRLRAAITTPVARLVHATTVVSETGDYSVRAEKLTGDEFGVLVDRFNEMLSRTGYAFHEVEKQRARFEFMAESMPQKIFTATAGGDIDYLNRQWLAFTGLSVEEMKGWDWTKVVHPEDVEANIRAWKHSLETGEPIHFEQRFRRADGIYRWHLSRALAMHDEDGRVTMWIGSNTDIHEQKEKEQELRRANEDLQQFAYSASHDLQEPIRNVAIYSEIVARRYENQLDEDGRQYLQFLKEGGHRLATLVNDLLAYTSASMAELSESRISAFEAFTAAVVTLAEPIREANAVVTADELPEIYMGGLHLQQVFQNLIGNAIKYRSEDPLRIHVSAQRMGSTWCFSVRDNGIGIDPQYKEKIFGLFKRLSHDPKYSGTGIGLAICQRVVERYGGRIWVESEPGNGSTFFFSIPQQVRAAAIQSSGG
jgi:PAS domain S-box-containing protein